MAGPSRDISTAHPTTDRATPAQTPVMLALGETRLGPWFPARWIGELVALGARTARYVRNLTRRQLVVVISVPTRDFAAVLIGCGWTLAARRPRLTPPAEAVAVLEPGTPVRVVTDHHVITDTFNGIEWGDGGERIRLGGRQWVFSHVKALAVLDELADAHKCRQTVPLPGSVSAWTGVSNYWEEHLAAPPADLAIVGTGSWLEDEMSASLGRNGATTLSALGDDIRGLLLPHTPEAATWSTKVYLASRFDPDDGLDDGLRAIVLDGANTATYLSAIEVPVVFVVLDRRAADETAAEAVLLHRSTGEPLSLTDKLHWQPMPGIEGLAYTVPL